MSGIAAIYYLDGRLADASVLSEMKNRLRHRGRDASGILLRGSAGLLHLLTQTTTDGQIEKLPAADADGRYFITSDARLDNRAELLGQLSFREEKAEKISDSQIILAAYEKWGQCCPAHLIGDYVFAIWDERAQKLFCARDPLGVKHFYYYHAPGKIFALASEIKALHAIEQIPRRLNEEHLGDYLVLNSEDKESTFFSGIKRLPATHALAISRERLQKRRYWQPDGGELRLKNDAEYEEAFREKFVEAVESRLRAASPAGSMLSGGLDSSAIVCVASRKLKEPLQTFSAVFPSVARLDKRIDESSFMQSVIEQSGCQPHFVNADDASPLRDIEKLLHHADHPVGAPNVYMDWEIYRAARDAGVRVLLSGTDGDSTVSHGYEDFAQFVRRGWFLRLLRESIALSRNMPRRAHNFKRLFWHRGVKGGAPDSLRSIWRTLHRRKPEEFPASLSSIRFPLNFRAVQPLFREKYRLEERVAKFLEENYPPGSTAAERHWQGLTSGHFSTMLEQLEKSAAAFGIEPRYPFFDRRLVEFCIALPPGQRICKGWTRSIFRRSMKGILPEDVRWRTDKSNIGASVKVNLLKYGYPQLERAINRESRQLERYLDVGILKNSYRDYQLDPLGREAEALLVIKSVYLLNWLEQTGFADATAETPRVTGVSRAPDVAVA